MQLTDKVTVETDAFEHRTVKPNFINPCCFGEDFAAWLKNESSSLLESGFHLSEILQEDYGWGFWAKCGNDSYWVALSYVGDGPTETRAQWIVSVSHDPGLNLIKRLFHRPSIECFNKLRDQIWNSLRLHSAIKVIDAHR